jgi:hypothetical protein
MIADAKNGWRNERAIRAFNIFCSTSAGDKLGIIFHETFIRFLPAKSGIER